MKNLRHLLSLLTLLWAATLSAATLWTGEEAISWSGGGSVQVSASAFADAQVGDELRLNFIFTGQTDWPQVSLRNGNWADLTHAGNILISASDDHVSYYLTTGMLEDLQQHGMVVTGIGYTLTSIELNAGNGGAGLEHAVWIGEKVVPNDWSGFVTLPASCFTSSAVGKIIRLHFKDLLSGAQAIRRTGSWAEMPDMASFVQLSGEHTDITITADMLTELKGNGCIVQGVGFTLTSVDIIGEEDLSKLQLSVPVVHQWLWTEGETPAFTVNITNPTAADADVHIVLNVKDDKNTKSYSMEATQTVAAGATLPYQLNTAEMALEPGFYTATILVDNEVARAFVFGYDPEHIVSAPDMQDDFSAFWQKAKADLAEVDPQYTLTEIPGKSTARRKVYLLEYHSVSDTNGEGIARAYFAEPTAPGTYPAIIHYNGYDGGTYDPWCMGGDDNPGYVELIVSTRGQLINNRPPYTNTYGDWFVFGFDSEDHYYYRGAFMDAVRAIDFLCSRETVQQANIFAEGASQGGALTLAAAALSDGRLNAIAPAVPFMGDFPDYFQIASWPGNAANGKRQQLGMTEEEMYRMLSYFDMKNLATLISCPTYMNYSLQDNVCPPHTNWASYNNLLSSEKKYLTNPTLGHETSGTWWTEYNQFFKDHLKDPDGIEETSMKKFAPESVYNLQGVKVGTTATYSTLPHGIYVVNGNKMVK